MVWVSECLWCLVWIIGLENVLSSLTLNLILIALGTPIFSPSTCLAGRSTKSVLGYDFGTGTYGTFIHIFTINLPKHVPKSIGVSSKT
jgi:hypothetical protein